MKLFGVTVACLFVLFLAPVALAADAPLSCGDLPCRADGIPYVSESGGIVIKPGEAFSVELTIEGDTVTKAVPRVLRSDLANSIELEFKTLDSGLMLKLASHVDHWLKIDMFMKLANGRLVRTSSCPLMANKGLFEMWNDSIVFLELRNIRIVKADSTMGCS